MPFSSRCNSWEAAAAADTSPAVASGPNTTNLSSAREEPVMTSPVTPGRHNSEKSLSSSQALDDWGDREGEEEGEEGRSARRKCVMPGTSSAGPGSVARLTSPHRVDYSVLTLLCLGFLVLQLDRMNLASALTVGYADDIGVDQDTINLGNQLMFLGTVLFEIPSNVLLQKFGPSRWISGQVFAFGLVATFQVFIHDRRGFLASRLILGVTESGYIPGALLTLSMWYRKQELAKRLAVFFFGMFGGSAVGPLLASGILKLHGKGGITGWQYLFLLEGVSTICVAVLFAVLLPASPLDPRALAGPGILRFSEADRQALQARLEPGQSDFGRTIAWKLVWDTVRNYRLWPHFLASFFVFSTWSPLTTYTPHIMVSLGFGSIEANALAAVGPFIALAVIFLFALISDRTQKRGATVIAAQFLYLAMLVVARSVHPYVGKWSRWGLWTAVNSFAVGYHPVHNTWLQLNCRDPGERSISIAMWVMSSNAGLMVGTQYFRGHDAPFYKNGLRTMIIMVSVGIFFTLLQTAVYIVRNRKMASDRRAEQEAVHEEMWTHSP